jgi:uncharacterized protein (DUF1778 family)
MKGKTLQHFVVASAAVLAQAVMSRRRRMVAAMQYADRGLIDIQEPGYLHHTEAVKFDRRSNKMWCRIRPKDYGSLKA